MVPSLAPMTEFCLCPKRAQKLKIEAADFKNRDYLSHRISEAEFSGSCCFDTLEGFPRKTISMASPKKVLCRQVPRANADHPQNQNGLRRPF